MMQYFDTSLVTITKLVTEDINDPRQIIYVSVFTFLYISKLSLIYVFP